MAALDDARPVSPAERALWWLAVGAIGAGAVMRFYRLGWGAPFHFHSDEQVLFHFTERLRTAPSIAKLTHDEIRFFLYPPLLMHVLLVLVRATSWVHRFRPDDPASLTTFLVLGRGLSAAFGTATLVLAWLLGERLYGRRVGGLAATWLAFCALHVRDSHFFTTDVALTFFFTLAAWTAAGLVDEPTPRRYFAAGATVGVGLGAKQTMLLAIPLLAVAHLLAFTKAGRPRARTLVEALRTRRFHVLGAIATATAVVTFLVANPYVLVAPGTFWAMSRKTAAFVSAADQPPWVFQFTGTSPAYWLTNVLWFGLGPPLEAAALAGLVWSGISAVYRRRAGDVLLLVLLTTYAAVVGRGFMKFVRYALPVLPVLCILGARLTVQAFDRARSRAARGAVIAFAALVTVSSLAWSSAYLHVYRRPDARLVAARWIDRNVPEGATLLTDTSPNSPPLGELFREPKVLDSYIQGRSLHAARRDRFQIKVLDAGLGLDERGRSDEWWRAYLAERLAGVDFIAISDEYPEQYRHRPEAAPEIARFYEELVAGHLGFHPLRVFKTRPEILGHVIDDDASELTWRLFDHPTVTIFARDGIAEPAPGRGDARPGPA